MTSSGYSTDSAASRSASKVEGGARCNKDLAYKAIQRKFNILQILYYDFFFVRSDSDENPSSA